MLLLLLMTMMMMRMMMMIEDTRNVLSKMSLFVRPKSISSTILSEFLIVVHIQSSYGEVFNLQTKICTDFQVGGVWRNAAFL